MRRSSPAWLLVALASCTVRVPHVPGVEVAVNTTIRAEARVAPPAAAVAVQGAEVVEFFGVPLDGAQDVVFVLDCSGSMAEPAQGRVAEVKVEGSATPVPSKIEVAREELVEALRHLPAGVRMNVIFFNDELEAFAGDLTPLEESGRDGLVGFVEHREATGSTALAPALRTAFLMNARRVVLLSDGLGNVGGDAGSVLRDAREAIRGGVRIDTIGLGASQDGDLLLALAQESGGLYQAF